MSFILDALKKSENERQRQIGPSLADIAVRRGQTDRPWWAVAVGALLVVNLGVLLVVLMRDRAAPESAPAPQPAMTASQTVAPAPSTAVQANRAAQAQMAAPTRTSPAVQSLAEAAGAAEDLSQETAPYDPSIESAAAVPEGPPVVRPITPPTVSPLPNQPAFAARERVPSTPAEEEMLPTHGSLVASGTNLPDMRLDIHVYSPNPRERFVFVNMRKYVEGQALSEGPYLERITTDGAILNQNGTRFLLPRQ